MPAFLKKRDNILVLVFGVVLAFFIGRMLQMQLIQGDEYESQIYKGTIKTQTVEAARGEMTDRYGNPIVTNRVSMNLVLDKAYLPAETQNEIILQLMGLLEQSGEQWVDELPVSQGQPYAFEGTDAEDHRPEKVCRRQRLCRCRRGHALAAGAFWPGQCPGEERGRQAGGPGAHLFPAGAAPADRGTVHHGAQGLQSLQPLHLCRGHLHPHSHHHFRAEHHFAGCVGGAGLGPDYPGGSMAAHILGHVGPLTEANIQEFEANGTEYELDDIIGQDGLEKLYETELQGEDGERLVYVNENGEVTDSSISVEPQAGNTVMLTLDSRLQKIAEQSIEDQIHHLNETAPEGQGREANAGAVCAIDVKTGEVLVLASYPSYDPNTLSEGYSELSVDPDRPLRNRALLDTYTPGSIFKPVVALAGLASGEIDSDSLVNCNHVYNYYASVYGAQAFTPTCLGYHGDITVKEALKYSCNIFFYDVGRRVGIDAIVDAAQMLGLGVNNGFELWTNPGTISSPATAEAAGEKWYYGDVLQSSIGQRFNKYTPLQLAAYCMNLANRGTQNRVTILKAIKDYSMAETKYEHKTEVLQESPVDPALFDPIFEGMVAASRTGTAASYFGNYPVDVASKTGTPETADLPNSTFICFAPADDPQIAISVVIEQGWHGYTGAPVARDILDAYFSSDVTAQEPQQSGSLLP